MFAGIAPIAADFHGMMDDMLRRKQGVDLPIHIVHGAQDHIFPVDPIRKGHALLARLGYDATYEELPRLGTFLLLGHQRAAGDALVREPSAPVGRSRFDSVSDRRFNDVAIEIGSAGEE